MDVFVWKAERVVFLPLVHSPKWLQSPGLGQLPAGSCFGVTHLSLPPLPSRQNSREPEHKWRSQGSNLKIADVGKLESTRGHCPTNVKVRRPRLRDKKRTADDWFPELVLARIQGILDIPDPTPFLRNPTCRIQEAGPSLHALGKAALAVERLIKPKPHSVGENCLQCRIYGPCNGTKKEKAGKTKSHREVGNCNKI